ncbi:parallel beta-helix repeat protein [Methanohalophilus levihalophilus]|nr:parallel beta-helix repeat protein [Methanohalophilus levihalophilus]
MSGDSTDNRFTNNTAISNEVFGISMESAYDNIFSGNLVHSNLNGDFYGDYYPNKWSTDNSEEVYGNLFQRYMATNSSEYSGIAELYYRESGGEWIKCDEYNDVELRCSTILSDHCDFYTIEDDSSTSGSLALEYSENNGQSSGEQLSDTSYVNDSSGNTKPKMPGPGILISILSVIIAFLLKRK